jgi:hypothetical protein
MPINRDEVKLFLNNVAVPGIQSVSLRPNPGLQPVFAAGLNNPTFLPGSQGGTLSLNSNLVSSDFFINLTGDVRFSGVIVRDLTALSNLSFTSGYLTSYNVNFAIGQIPEISIEADIFGNIGDLDNVELEGLLTGVQNQTFINQTIRIPSPGSIRVTLTGWDTTVIKSCGISVASPRRADFGLGSKIPIRVVPQWPLQISCRLNLDMSHANLRNLRSYESISESTDIQIVVDDFYSKTNICNYFFENMRLISASPSADVGSPESLDVLYQGLLYPRPALLTESLQFYFDSSHPKNQNPQMFDLTLNDKTGIATGIAVTGMPVYLDRHIKLDGNDDYIQFNNALTLGPNFSAGVWVRILDFAPSLSGAMVYSFTTAKAPKGLSLSFNLGEMACWSSGENLTNTLNELPSDTNWHFYGIVNDAVEQRCSFYFDGNFITQGTYFDTTTTTGHLRLGSSVNGGYYFFGQIDYLAIYNKALNNDGMSRVYKATKPV